MFSEIVKKHIKLRSKMEELLIRSWVLCIHRYEITEKAGVSGRRDRPEPKWKKYRRGKSEAKDRRLEKTNAWLTDSQEDEKQMEWQQYLNSLTGR